MSNFIFKMSLWVVLLLLLKQNVFTQPSKGGTPPSITFHIQNNLPALDYSPNINIKSLMLQDSIEEKQGFPLRGGISVSVSNVGLNSGGTWTKLPDGRMMWQAMFYCANAKALGVVFDEFFIPEQAELYLYDINKQMIIGAFTSDNNHPSMQFSTHILPGTTIIVEYVEPFNLTISNQTKPEHLDNKNITVYSINNNSNDYIPKGSFRIAELIYVYRDQIFSDTKDLGDAGPCEVNINCSPEGDGYQAQKRGVARILFKEGAGWYYCSGTLVNNTAQNGQPYFLTAFHCGATASSADKNVWQFYFNYERPGCSNTGTPPNNMITGCSMKASGDISGGSDMQLVLLNTTPPLSWNPYYNGWDRNTTTTAGGVGIHHPSGDAKKISTYTVTPGSGTWSGGATNAHWTLSWATTTNGAGVTEGGSSGSPLFKGSNKLVIGTLTGGASQCGGPMGTDYYGKFSYHWESNGTTNDKKLRPWLDPLGTNPTTLNGFDPNAVSAPPVADFSASPTTVTAGSPVQFTDLSSNVPTEWEWSFPGGFPSTSTLRNPSVTYSNPGTYSVTLTAKNAYGQNTTTKTNYITVNAYTPPSSPIIIGTGTSTGNVIPLGKSNTASWIISASIYLASEIGPSCIIEQIAWQPSSARTDSRNIRIYMKHTSQSSFTSAGPATDLIADATLVFNGTFVPNATGWFPFVLQTPFNYIAGNNLMVITVVSATAANAQSNCYYTSSTNRHQQWTGTSDPSANNGTINSNRPNIRLTVSGYTAPVANFAGINPILTEDFEGTTFPPANWTINNVDGGGTTWTSSTSFNHTNNGNKSAAHIYSAAGMQDGYLITPQITNLPSNAILSFWSYNQYPTYYGGTYQGKNSVLVSTTNTNPTSFTEIWSPSSVSASWVQTTIDLSAYAGQNIYIAFRYQGNDAHSWFLDDISIGSFNYTQINTYEGDPLVIYDKSTNNPTLWEWTCPGSTTPNVYTQNANLVYNVAGQYNVTLRAGNPAGSNTKTVNNYVNVIGRPPISNFVGVGNLKNIYGQPFIPIGGTVDFYDRSLRVPTSWLWTFENANPSTSNLRNPTNITYNISGLHDVTLYTQNNHGNNTGTATDYVIVGGLDTCTNFIETDNLAIYNYTNGLIPGHAADVSGKFYRYAEFFNNNYPGKLYGFGLYVYRAQGTGKTITIKVWDDNNGIPGNELYSESRSITSFTQGQYNIVTFTNPVNITGKFYIGWVLNYDVTHNYTTHQFCAVMSAFRNTDTASTGFLSYGSTSPGTWYSFLNAFGNAASLWIDAIFEYNFTGPTVTASATPGCLTGSVTITSSETAIQTFVLTDNAGNTIQSWTSTSPTNTYTFTGLADGVYRGKTINGGNESQLSPAVTLTNYPSSVGGTISGTNTQICLGSSTGTLLLSGHTGNVVKWQKRFNAGTWQDISNSNTTYSETPSTAGTWDYRAEVQSGTCPSQFSTIYTIIVDPSSVGGTLNGPNTNICLGSSTGNMIVSGYTGNIQKWQKRLNAGAWQDIANVTNTYSEIPGTAGTWDYRVEVKSGTCGVAYSNIFTIIVNSLPNASAASNSPVCAGATLNLTSLPNGMASYNWAGPGGWTANTQNPSRTNITTAQAGTYTVTITDANSCTGTASVNVVVNAPPTASASSNSPVCENGTINLTATPNGMTYNWSGPNSFTSSQQNPSILNASAANVGIYSVTITDGNNCTSVASTNVTLHPVIIVNAGTDQTIPNGTSTTLNGSVSGGSGNFTYAWSPSASVTNPNNLSTNTINLTSTTNFTLLVTDQVTGCQQSDEIIVFVSGGPLTATASATPTTICAGNSSQLSVSASGGSGTYTYSWSSNPSGFTSTIQNPVVSPTITTIYTVTVNDGFNTVTSSITVTVNPVPSATASSNSPLCTGATLNLTSSPNGMIYSWSGPGGWTANTQNPSRTNITTAQAGTYTVTVTNNTTGCSSTASTIVIVNTPPTASVSSNSPLCAGATLNLTSLPNGMTSYNWAGPGGWTASTQNPSRANITTAQAGTYTVTITDANNCTGTASVNVVVNTPPTVSASSNSPICEGATLNLTSLPNGMASYNWAGPGGWTASTQNPSRANITTAQAGTYTVTVTDANSCTGTASVNVVVNTPPTVSASSNSPICEGATLNLTSLPNGMTSYNWTGPGGWTANTQNATITNFTTAQAGTYTVTIIDANNCSGTASVNVVVNTNPTVSLSSNSPVCEGQILNLTSLPNGMTSYNWAGPGGWTANTQNATITNITTAQAGTYTVTATNSNGCTGTASLNVIVNTLPLADAGQDVTICEGSSTILTASGGSSYEWNTGAYTQSINVSPSTTTTYTVIVYDANGCSASDAVTVTVNPLPVANAGADQVICEGSTTTLTATGGIIYLWSTNENTASIQISPTTSTLYSVTVTDINGCSNTDAVFVSVIPNPIVFAGNDQEVCEDVEVVLNANGALTYTWDNGVINNVGFYPPVGTHIYTVIGTDANGCTASDQVVVTVYPKPLANAGNDVSVCLGSTVNLTATGGDSYMWSNGMNTAAIAVSPLVTTTYYVTVSNSFGCAASDEVVVTVNDLPIVSAGNDVMICEGQSTMLTASGGILYEWGTGETTSSIVVSPSLTTLYYVTVTDANGCSDIANVTVIVNTLPMVQFVSTNAQCGMNNGSVEVIVSGGSGNYTYQWDANTGNQTTAMVDNLPAGIYSVTVDDGFCPVESSGEILEDGAPTISIQATTTEICEGESIILIANGADTYVWTPSTYLNINIGNEVIATPLTNITYTVTGTSGNCSAEESISIIVNPLPHAYMAISNISGGEYEFSDMSLNATSWLWDFGDGNTDNNQNTSHIYTADGSYIVMLIASNNCGSDTALQTIQVIISQISTSSFSSSLQAYPNPNNGLFNLTLESAYKGIVNIVIYNVEGKKVFSQDIDKQSLKQNIPMNMKSLTKGVYRILVKEGTDLKYATIVIDKL